MTATDEVGRSNDAVASITPPPSPRHHHGVTTVIDTPAPSDRVAADARQRASALVLAGELVLQGSATTDLQYAPDQHHRFGMTRRRLVPCA